MKSFRQPPLPLKPLPNPQKLSSLQILLFLYIIHVFLFLLLYSFVLLCDYISIFYLAFDLI